jgi:uncharacterized membrane protein
MSDLVRMVFGDPDTANLALNEIQRMQKEYLVDLQDASVLVRDAGGKVHLKQSIQLVKPAALGGASFGASSRAIAGAIADCGVRDDFIRQSDSAIAPDTSALVKLFGRMPKTSLSNADADRQREALPRVQEPAA